MSSKHRWWRRLGTPSAIYGTIVFSGLVAVASIEDHGPADAGDTLLVAAVTLVVFWTAHVFAGALSPYGHHSETELGFRESIRASLADAVGMLEAAILPSIILGLGAAGLIDDMRSITLALQVSVVILGVLGFMAARARNARWWWRVLAAAVAASLGFLIIVIEAALH